MTYDSLKGAAVMMGMVTLLSAQQPALPRPVQAQSASTMAVTVKDKEAAVEITNAAYEMTSQGVPGLAPGERLMLRTTTHTKSVIDEIGMEASTTIQAWPLGVDLKQRPLYSVTTKGVDPRTLNNELLTVLRGLEEVEWWSVYKLGSGAHLFDTYVPLNSFSVGVETQELRYVGLEVPGDDTLEPRLKAPGVVAVLTYASADHVIREALITCDKRDLAVLLRSFADSSRKVSVAEHRVTAAGKKGGDVVRTITITIVPNYPSPPAEYSIVVPIVKDDLDLARATGSAGVHAVAWKR